MIKPQSNKKKQKKTKMRNNKKKHNYTLKKMKGGNQVKIISKIFPSNFTNSKGYNVGKISYNIVGTNKIYSNFDQVDYFLDNLYTYAKGNKDKDILSKVFRYTGDKYDSMPKPNNLELIITPELDPIEKGKLKLANDAEQTKLKTKLNELQKQIKLN